MPQLRWIADADGDALAAASALFDYSPRVDASRHFLDRGGHHLCLAYVEGEPVGFVSGVDITHPDKGTEMFLYELAVAPAQQRRGIGRALVEALADRARALDCYGMWVLTDAENAAALAVYRSAGAHDVQDAVMLTWRLEPAHPTFVEPTA